MTKNDAHALLDKIRDGMPMAGATEALRLTGDIYRVFDKSLCVNRNEQSNIESFTIHGASTSELKQRIGYSRYLDCQTNKGVTQ